MGLGNKEMTPRDARITLLIFGVAAAIVLPWYFDVLGPMLCFWTWPAELWLLFAGFVLALACLVRRACQRSPRPGPPPAHIGDGSCPQCGYDLRHTRTRCPECGHWINPPHLKEYR